MNTQSEPFDWFAACRKASAYAFTLKAELRGLQEKNRLLHQRHLDDNVEYMRVLTQRDALLEALKSVTSATDLATYGAALHEARAVIKTVEATK